MTVLTEIKKGQVLNLPTHAERCTFGLGWVGAESLDCDLSAILLDETGALVDVVYHRCLSSKGFCVRHLGDETSGLFSPDGAGESIAFYPRMVPDKVKAIFIVANVGHKEKDTAGGLSQLEKLHLTVTAFDPARYVILTHGR
jgi:stress response protein SCP2